jgi:hypothetical protein
VDFDVGFFVVKDYEASPTILGLDSKTAARVVA